MTASKSPGWFAWLAIPAIVAAALLAANSIGTYPISGSQLGGMEGWPQPLGWITRLLVIESWPTYERIEVRWLAWAAALVGLVGLAAVTTDKEKRRQGEEEQRREAAVGGIFGALVAACAVLAVLVAARAAFAAVPVVGLAGTWQLVLALLWMLVVYVWTVRLGVGGLARAIALAVAGLAAISLLCYVQSDQPGPVWPSGNVLLLTTNCLAGVFLLGAWAYSRIETGRRTGRRRDYAVALLAAGLLGLVLIALWLAGWRAGAIGLAAGAGFILIVMLLRWIDASAPESSRRSRRARRAILVVTAAVLAAGAVVTPAVLNRQRWWSVMFRVETYKATAGMLADSPASPWLGVGPGQVGFRLTAAMRPFRAESAQTSGGVEDVAHSEPLQALAELGLPLGLLYLALPLGALLGFGVACREAAEESSRLMLLGAGGALAACLAAEATGIGMRYPGVAMLVWTLVGMGWASGAQAGGFARLVRWLGPAARVLHGRHGPAAAGAVGGLISLVVLGLAWRSVQATHDLYKATQAWGQGQSAQAAALLQRWPAVPGSGSWMAWKYTQGRVSLVLAGQAASQEARALRQTEAVEAFTSLCNACPAYLDAPVWLGRAEGDWGRIRTRCEQLLRYDPYNHEARMSLAAMPEVSPTEQLTSLRLAIRNESVSAAFASMLTRATQDPPAQQLLTRWTADAQQALQEKDPAKWPDPMAPESLRIAIVLAGQQGRTGEAYDLAEQAAILLRAVNADSRHARSASVDTEVLLDRAWFGWLLQPERAGHYARTLEANLQGAQYAEAPSYSAKMALQFTAMLLLGQDRFEEASHALYVSDPTIQRDVLMRWAGLACARLVTIMGPRTPAGQVAAWTRQGVNLLGPDLWKQALAEAAGGGTIPWWFGVLSD